MTARFDLVTIDSTSPDELASFWSIAVGLHEVEREDGDRWIVLADDGNVRRLGLQRGEPASGGVHLDLRCAPVAFDTETERLITLGARLLAPPRNEPWGRIANLVDPEGNAFDLCAYPD